MKIKSKMFGLMAGALFCAAGIVTAQAQNLNGTLDPTFYGTPLYVQTVNTGFGNSAGGGDASGSELDAVYAKVSGGNLYLFVAGCFQNNGNHLNVFIAGGNPGQNTLNISPSTESAMNGSIFPVGFNATYMIDANDSGGTLYVDGFALPNGSQASQAYLGPVPLTGGIGSAILGGTTFALNNTLTSTMGTGGQALSGAGSGANTTTGLEIEIPTSAIGYSGGSVNVLIDINGGGNGYLSNQFLPGLPVPSGNPGGSTFNFGPAPTPTNYVTFQVDMTAQVELGNFINDNNNAVGDPNGSITVSGGFEGAIAGGAFNNGIFSGWDNGLPMTNNPMATGSATNIFVCVAPIVAILPDAISYKFRMNGGWEGVANRTPTITSNPQVLPVVFYNNNSPYDLVSAPITVTFSIYMPDGTLDDGNNITAAPYPFDPEGGDTLWINADFLNNWNNDSWPGPVGNFPAAQQMIEVGTSGVYTNSFVVPKGNSIVLTYKYSIDSTDDENGFATNHVREIRSYGPTYAMPQDVWSWSVLQPNNGNPYVAGLGSTNIIELDFGNLVAGAPSGGNVPITWLGRPAVLLQNSSSLSGGIWNNNNATDGTQSINWPNTGGSQFFRLMKKQ